MVFHYFIRKTGQSSLDFPLTFPQAVSTSVWFHQIHTLLSENNFHFIFPKMFSSTKCPWKWILHKESNIWNLCFDKSFWWRNPVFSFLIMENYCFYTWNTGFLFIRLPLHSCFANLPKFTWVSFLIIHSHLFFSSVLAFHFHRGRCDFHNCTSPRPCSLWLKNFFSKCTLHL